MPTEFNFGQFNVEHLDNNDKPVDVPEEDLEASFVAVEKGWKEFTGGPLFVASVREGLKVRVTHNGNIIM